MTATGGSGIATSATGSTATFDFAPTELNSLIFGSGTFTTLQFNAGAYRSDLHLRQRFRLCIEHGDWTFNGNTVLLSRCNEGLSGGGLIDCDGESDLTDETNKFACGSR